jgi:hypothetical protein|tara:strand:- start:2609 stop:2824 length:216 start_codon:yes stop_codon:yes gene_type:complete
MSQKTIAFMVIAAGVVLNNYAYLHDLLVAKHNGYIIMGVKSGIAALVGISLIGLGSYLLAKSVTARKQSPS